jgi:O-antigen/teichoic acid export membrane protein
MAAVTPYQVGGRLAMLNRILPLTLLGALLPNTTAAVSAGLPKAEMERRYAQNLRYLMLSTMLITGFIVATADLFIRTWIGRPVPQAGLIAIALALSCAINNMTGIGTVFVKANGQPRYEAYYGMVSTGLNILFTILLTPRFGIYGVAGGTIIGNVLGSCFFVAMFHRLSGFSWWRTTGSWLIRLVAACAMAVALTRASVGLIPVEWTANRLSGVAALAVCGVIYMIGLIAALSLLRFWNGSDRENWRRASERMPQPIRAWLVKPQPAQRS